MTSILVASTIPAFKMRDGDQWNSWLQNSQQITEHAHHHQVDWLAALQIDARGDEPFWPLLDQLDLCRGRASRFSIDTGEHHISSSSRLAAICTGRNLIIDHALAGGHEWIYFADSDISAPDDVLPRLLELNWPVCGAHVPTYCLDGPQARNASHAAIRRAGEHGDVRVHWNTAGALLVAREAFRRVPWRFDPDAGQTDDPATQAEMARLGWPTLVRHDVICTHHPETIGPLETRGHDLTVYR